MTRVWAVLDKSREGKNEYDTKYFDGNAIGDLTEPGERWMGPGPVKVDAFRDPATGDVHETHDSTPRLGDSPLRLAQRFWLYFDADG